MIEYDQRFSADRRVLAEERAHRRAHAEHLEIVAAHQIDEEPLRLLGAPRFCGHRPERKEEGVFNQGRE